MRIDNDDFNNANTGLSKDPRYVIEISFDTTNTDLLHITSHADAALPVAAVSIDGVVINMSGTSQSVTPEKSLSTIGGVDFEVVDKTSAVTAVQYAKLELGYGLRGKRVRVYVGYEGLLWDAYTLVQTQIIEQVSYADGKYKFQCDDIQRAIRKDVFDTAVSNLTTAITIGDTAVNITSTTKFQAVEHGASYSDAPDQTVYYFKVEDEIFRATGKTAGSFTGVTGGVLNTRKANHTIDTTASADRQTEVSEYVYLELPIPKLIYAVLTGKLLGQGAAVLPDTWHLNIAEALVRDTDFTGYGEDVYDTTSDENGVLVRFEGIEKQDGKAFIEKELLVLMGGFSPIYSDGAIGLKRMASVLSNSGFVYLLDEDNIVSHGDLVYDMKNVHNHIEIDWNWVDSKERFTRTNVLLDQESVNKHGESNPLLFKFRGLHGSRHSAETLGERFNSFRDRYTGPPIRLSVKCLLGTNMLEVGDVVRVRLDTLRDHYTNSTLDRSFEIQNVSVDWITGAVDLRLFASSQAAGTISSTTATGIIDDPWYVAEGINLATHVGAGYDYITDYENIGGVGHIKTTSSILGGLDLTSASGVEGDTNSVFYHDGDLIIDAAVILSITKNIQLRVKGHLTINGGIEGIGTGHAGAADRADIYQEVPDVRAGAIPFNGGADPSYIHNNGVAGFIGPTVSGGGERYENNKDLGYIKSMPGNKVDGLHTTTPNLTLEYNNIILTLNGQPTDLQGCSGSSGGNESSTTGGTSRINDGWHVLPGGAGGNSGAGLMVVSRGATFGASGYINVSGTDGAFGMYQRPYRSPTYYYLNSSTTYNLYPRYAGGGAGGAPGAVYFAIDGDQNTFPDLTPIIARYGCTRTGGTNRVGSASYRLQDLYFPWTGYNFGCLTCPPVWYPYDLGVGCDNADLSGYDGGSRVVFIVGAEIPQEDLEVPPPDISTLTASLVSGAVVFNWTPVIATYLDGYEVRYVSRTSGDGWESGVVVGATGKATTTASSSTIPDGDWTFMVKAFNVELVYSVNAATSDLVVTSNYTNIITTDDEFPLWSGTLTNLVKLFDNKLMPDSQLTMDNYITWADFENANPDPYANSYYEIAVPVDAGIDALVRVWSYISSYLAPGEVSINSPVHLDVDYRTNAGSYSGFIPWTIGDVTAQFVKFRVHMDNTIAISILHGMVNYIDAEERSESGVAVIGATGTTVSYANPFFTAPTITVSPQGATPLVVTRSNITATGFDAHVFDGAVEVGGTIDWTATGV